MPDKLKEMQNLFVAEAKKYNVLPLDNSTLTRLLTPRPSTAAGRTTFTYSGELSGVPDSSAPSILQRSYTITADVEIPEGGAEGMIVTEGGRFAGYGLFLSKGELGVGRGKPVFLYNLLDVKRTAWEGPELKPGKHTITFDFRFDGGAFGAFPASRALSEDGRIVAVPTPGHTPGHISVICVDDEGRHVMLAGDATDTLEQLHALRADAIGPDPKVHVATLETILAHCARHPTVYLPSHDPESAARLASAGISPEAAIVVA